MSNILDENGDPILDENGDPIYDIEVFTCCLREFSNTMNQSDRDELLVRIDQKVINIEKSVFSEPTCANMKTKI